MQRKKQVGYN